ncbi:MAG: Sensor histidine kinase YehU [Candidatus Ordinivivax streblomastigis]|uniref:Sensor histidine kinase YehU n=1 Tax=Candidatus Ordinivivax streblomastigis TaxID=2540710 RepID=A0A5M8P2Q4_9BACT|nr:MAG: Sensor histidine kinase YehU [Candidatus Ordinivivax streblomastigis]
MILAHTIGWAVFIVFPILNEPGLLHAISRHPMFFLASNLFLISYFYFNLTVFVPCFLSKKKIILFFGITLACVSLFFILPWIFRSYFSPERPPFRPDNMPFPNDMMKRLGIYTRSTHFLLVFIVSTGIKVISQWYEEKNRLKEMESSKVEAELSFLKSQIHPHFLFNSLNSIYYLALSKDDKAPKAILSLSDFLRFVTVESDKNLISLEKEIKMLNEYLNLQSLRTSEKFDLQVNMQGDFSSQEIMPLVFIPFVENAFKYGISAHVDCFVHLNIEIEKGILEFSIKNSIFQGQKEIVSSSSIGLENIKKRLELSYSDRYTLDIKSDRQVYSVFLKMNLK